MSQYEWVGCLASIIIIISLSMKSSKYLRIFNILGSAIFLVYGVLIHSPSSVVLNIVAIVICLYRLKKKKGDPEND